MPASSATVIGSIHNVCTEAAFLLLAMLRSMLNLVKTMFCFVLFFNKKEHIHKSQSFIWNVLVYR